MRRRPQLADFAITVFTMDNNGKDSYTFTTQESKRGGDMPMLSPKRQITIPKELCDRLHMKPGDEVDIFEHDEKITLFKKRRGSSGGALKHLKADNRFTEEQSLRDAVEKRGAQRTARKSRSA